MINTRLAAGGVALTSALLLAMWDPGQPAIANLTSHWFDFVPLVLGLWLFAAQVRLFTRYLPRGSTSTYTIWQIRAVNPKLAREARCPACGTRNLLWYAYSPSSSLAAGDAIYIRCQRCGHDDYADL